MGLTVGVLGPVALAVDGRSIELPSGMQRALLATLALRAGKATSPTLLVDVLWGDDPPASARGTLQAHLSRLRRLLVEHGVPDAITTRPDGYVLDVVPRAVDAVTFGQSIAEAREAIRSADPATACELLEAALDLWRDVPLADLPDGSYVEAQRQRLEALHLDALELHATAALADVDPADLSGLVADLEALVAAQPLHERFWALLMKALQNAGRDAEAILAYERARATLADTLGVDPGPELRELHAELLTRDAERSAEAAASPVRAPVRHNLPTPLTSFVGRQELRDELAEMLGDRRLVTLVGPGGAGKTRLALEVAHRIIGRCPDRAPDGVWFADLAAVDDPVLVPAAVAAAMGVREQAGQALEERLVTILRDARTLLVLDNCEHVVDAAARLAEALLLRCPQLRVLATSREPLGVTGEVLRELAGLDLAAAETETDRHADAVELLVQRAADVRPGFVTTGADIAIAADVCRQLDGLPLALEIAAAQLRTRSLEELAEMLRQRFHLVAEGSRTAPARQRTLEGAIAWSCELLSPVERELLGQLAIFPGSFAEDAALAACRVDDDLPAEPSEMRQLLAGLVQRSLVGTEVTGAETRYRLLETIRAYARDRLAPDDQSPLLARLHAWAAGLADEAEAALRGPQQQAWLDRLDRERDILRVVLRWAADLGPPTAVGEVAVPLLWFWIKRGRMVEGQRWLAVAAARDTAPGRSRLDVLTAWAVALENVQGPAPELDRVLDEARHLSRELGDDHAAAWNACWTGMGCWDDLDRARDWLVEAERSFEALGDRWARALTRMYLTFIDRLRGDYDAAEQHASLAVSDFDALGELWGAAMTRSMLGVLARYRRDWDRSRCLLERSLTTATALGSPDAMIGALLGLAVTAELEGDLEGAIERFERSAQLARRAGSVSLVAESLAAAGGIAVRTGDMERALGHVEAIADDEQLAGYRRALATALDVTAWSASSMGDPYRAASLHANAVMVRTELGEQPRPELAEVLAPSYQQLRTELGDADFERAWASGTEADALEAVHEAVTILRSQLRINRAGAHVRARDGAPTA